MRILVSFSVVATTLFISTFAQGPSDIDIPPPPPPNNDLPTVDLNSLVSGTDLSGVDAMASEPMRSTVNRDIQEDLFGGPDRASSSRRRVQTASMSRDSTNRERLGADNNRLIKDTNSVVLKKLLDFETSPGRSTNTVDDRRRVDSTPGFPEAVNPDLFGGSPVVDASVLADSSVVGVDNTVDVGVNPDLEPSGTGKSTSFSLNENEAPAQNFPVPVNSMAMAGRTAAARRNRQPPKNCPGQRPDETSMHFYLEVIFGAWTRRPCPPGLGYDHNDCGCTVRINHDSDICKPGLRMDFTYGIQDTTELMLVTEEDAREQGLTRTNDYLCFDGQQSLVINRYNSYDFGEHFYFTIRFFTEQTVHELPHPIVTNCVGKELAPSFGIVLNANQRGDKPTLSVFINTTETGTRIHIFPIKKGEWNSVKVEYNGATFTAIVNNERATLQASGKIEIRNAPITFGECKRYGSFVGCIDDVSMYTCDRGPFGV